MEREAAGEKGYVVELTDEPEYDVAKLKEIRREL